ncbi:hypothetical protein NKCBBBOE_03918 [Pseudarthrobacter sp. MM222]|nr:hypothetical protein NKCBBBOE_03918 [Pseudarthrobacter sp. MM222]
MCDIGTDPGEPTLRRVGSPSLTAGMTARGRVFSRYTAVTRLGVIKLRSR